MESICELPPHPTPGQKKTVQERMRNAQRVVKRVAHGSLHVFVNARIKLLNDYYFDFFTKPKWREYANHLLSQRLAKKPVQERMRNTQRVVKQVAHGSLHVFVNVSIKHHTKAQTCKEKEKIA
jgi:hypothetical protein